MLTQTSPEWPTYILWPSGTRPSSPCTLAVWLTSQLIGSWGSAPWVSPAGQDTTPPSNQAIGPADPLLHLSSHIVLEGWGPPASLVSAAINMASSLVGSLVGATSLEDNSTEANILVGSSMGAVSPVVDS